MRDYEEISPPGFAGPRSASLAACTIKSIVCLLILQSGQDLAGEARIMQDFSLPELYPSSGLAGPRGRPILL